MITNEKLIDIMLASGADVEKSSIEPGKTFENIGMDSLDMYNFFVQIEEELGVEVPDEVFEELDTLEKVRAYLEK